MHTIKVDVQNDLFEVLSRTKKPILAVAELIWNSLDADADKVNVDIETNSMGGTEAITVTDNGAGIPYTVVDAVFGSLGGSWKRQKGRTERGRIMHGHLGKGRYRAFFLGSTVEWTTWFSDNGNLSEYNIRGCTPQLKLFEVSDPKRSNREATGTRVRITGFTKNFPSIQGEEALQAITEHFALYLSQYNDVEIQYQGHRIGPGILVVLKRDYDITVQIEQRAKLVNAQLIVIEWKHPTQRTFCLCDENGFTLSEVMPGIHAPNLSFTAYLKSSYIRELEDQGFLDMQELHPGLKTLLEAARAQLRVHYKDRKQEMAVNLVEEWKREKVYPYMGEPQDLLEGAERQVFDIVALTVNDYLPQFADADPKSKRLSLKLLRQALETSPSALRLILQEVLELPEDKQEEFATLLKKTTLSALIATSSLITGRLEFIQGLDALLFEKRSREQLLERRQLHRIVAEEAWVFGEQYHLAVDDGPLTEVLKKHIELLGKGPIEVLDPVNRPNGSSGIIDLMFSRVICPVGGDRQHLVVELKRPKVKVDDAALTQIENYAMAVATDERFRDTSTRWVFWAVSNEISEPVRRKARQRNRPVGLVYDDDDFNLTIWVKTWAQLLEECRARLAFFKEKLSYEANRDSGLDYLRKAHARYLPPCMKTSTSEESPAQQD